jgi:hypothetical protein
MLLGQNLINNFCYENEKRMLMSTLTEVIILWKKRGHKSINPFAVVRHDKKTARVKLKFRSEKFSICKSFHGTVKTKGCEVAQLFSIDEHRAS